MTLNRKRNNTAINLIIVAILLLFPALKGYCDCKPVKSAHDCCGDKKSENNSKNNTDSDCQNHSCADLQSNKNLKYIALKSDVTSEAEQFNISWSPGIINATPEFVDYRHSEIFNSIQVVYLEYRSKSTRSRAPPIAA